ncbi:MAG: POTRA domain-containing protein [Terriglobales bacterium]
MKIWDGATAVLAVACGLGLAGCGHRTRKQPANRGEPTAPRATASQVAPAASYPTITAIHAMGTRRYSSAEIARASGLKVGQRFSQAIVHAAEQRLAASGAFTSVDALLVPGSNGQIVDLELADNPHFYPVRFRGFDSWDPARLRNYLRQPVPLFTGEVPLLRLGVARQVQRSLQQLASEEGWPGRVEMNISLTNGGNGVVYRLAR